MNQNAITREIRKLTHGERFDAYASRTDGAMLALALAFLVIWTLTSVAEEQIPHKIGLLLGSLNFVIWVIFAADLVIRVVTSKHSWGYVLKHPIDVLAVAIPMLRPLKILTIFTTGGKLMSASRAFKTSQAVVVSAVLLIWVGGVASYNAEHDAAGAQIVTFGNALWYSLVTVTTVGYGDYAPVTLQGRLVAAALMVVGISLLGVVTASVAAWFVRLTSAEQDRKDKASVAKNEREIKKLHAKVDELQAKIDLLVERSGPRDK